MSKMDDHGHKEKNKHYDEDDANHGHLSNDEQHNIIIGHKNKIHEYHLAMNRLNEQYRKEHQRIMKDFEDEEDAWASHLQRPEPDPHVHSNHHHKGMGSAQVSTLDPKMVKSVTSNICKRLGIHVSQ
jgi:hypothetical protein